MIEHHPCDYRGRDREDNALRPVLQLADRNGQQHRAKPAAASNTSTIGTAVSVGRIIAAHV